MLIKAINAWSFPGGLEGTLDPMEAIRLAKQFGFEGVELGVGDSGSAFGLDVTAERLSEIRSYANEHGIALKSIASGLYWSRALGDEDPANRRQAQEDLKRMSEIAGALGARTILVIPGAVDVFFLPDRPAQEYSSVLAYAEEGLRAVLPYAAEQGVRLGIENVWNRFLTSPDAILQFIQKIGAPNLGAYVDVANLLPFGYAEQWLRMLGGYVFGIHFKDYRRAVGTAEGFVDLLEGDVNWPEVMMAISEIAYEGPLVAEMIPLYKHHPLVRVENTSRAMDKIMSR